MLLRGDGRLLEGFESTVFEKEEAGAAQGWERCHEKRLS